jgi:coenzyme PQQ precursor peptide PqqA
LFPKLEPAYAWIGPAPRRVREAGEALGSKLEEINMAWTTPVIVEVCVGMEITSYSSAEI